MPSRMLVNCPDLSIYLDAVPLVQGLSLSVAAGEIIALIGANGCGKSTLLEEIRNRAAGTVTAPGPFEPHIKGAINLPSSLAVGYLRQMIRGGKGTPSSPTAGRAAKLAVELGLDSPERSADSMSDGELQKAALAHVLTAESELLLLDEPTNYLDIAGLTVLEQHLDMLRRRGMGILIVTHDRTLTDNVADETVLMTRERCYRMPGGASAVWAMREDDISHRQQRTSEIKRKIRQLQDDVSRKNTWGANKEASKKGAGRAKPAIAKAAARLHARAKVSQRKKEWEIAKLEKTKPFVPKPVHLILPERTVRRRQVFSAEDVTFGYAPDRPILEDVTIGAMATDKTCLMGANGSGKSTLLKLIAGELEPAGGELARNMSVPVAVVPQGLAGYFTAEKLLDNFADCPLPESEIRRALGAVQLRREKVLEKVSAFSYGELMRAAVVRCLLAGAEFLILDEPTSHLDIETIQVLSDLLQRFDGGFLIVSHDRAFVAEIAERLYVLEDKRLRLV